MEFEALAIAGIAAGLTLAVSGILIRTLRIPLSIGMGLSVILSIAYFLVATIIFHIDITKAICVFVLVMPGVFVGFLSVFKQIDNKKESSDR